MLRPHLLLVTLATVVATTLPSARACPAPPRDDPNYRCTKYDRMIGPDDRMVGPAVPLPAPARYLRARPLYLPRRLTPAAALRVLVTSRWQADGADAGARGLRLLDGANVPDTVSTDDTNVIIHALTWRRGHYRVDIAGTPYQLERCRDARRRPSACLVPALELDAATPSRSGVALP